MPTRLHSLDLLLIVVYLAGITLFGLRFRKRDSSLASYFLASRTVPWWAIALSIVSAETSTLTIISVPGIAFGSNFTFLQLVFGYMVGRVVLCVIFLPRYFQGELFTAYQLIDRRFGRVLHKVTAALFLLTRAAAEGVRVFAVSIVVGIAIGTNDIVSIGIISLLTLLYTFEGGMAAVIWTDVVQMGIYVFGTIVALFTLGHKVSGGWPAIHAVAADAGKLRVFDFSANLTAAYTFWAGVLGGAFLTMASHGTDQLMVQRLLAARNLRESRLALLASGGVVLMQFTLFLVIGTGLFVFYGQHPQAHTVAGADRIFPRLHRAADAAGHRRSAGRGDSGCGDVESFGGAQFPLVHNGCRFFTCACGPLQPIANAISSPAAAPWFGRSCCLPLRRMRWPMAARAMWWRRACRSPQWPMARCLEFFCWAR